MAFYTKNGDEGETTLFVDGCLKKISKDSLLIEALGALDELNSFLGLCKIKSSEQKAGPFGEHLISDFLEIVQNDLFMIQAELAGARKKLGKNRTEEIERIIDHAEKEIPVIKNFVIPGGCESSALLDFARALARRTERKMVAAKKEAEVGAEALKYINRLSSLLFVMARLANVNYGIKEKEPEY